MLEIELYLRLNHESKINGSAVYFVNKNLYEEKQKRKKLEIFFFLFELKISQKLNLK